MRVWRTHPSCLWLVFCFLNGTARSTDILNFDEVQRINFLILGAPFLVSYLKHHCLIQGLEAFLTCSLPSFIALALIFNSMINSNFIFYGWWEVRI